MKMAKKKVEDRKFYPGDKVILDHSMKIIRSEYIDGVLYCTCRVEYNDGTSEEILFPSHALSHEEPLGFQMG